MGAFYELSQVEREIMEVIWERTEAVTAGELLTVFARRAWKAQTMSTFLSRLADKGMLRGERQGRCTRYRPALSREEYRRQRARHVVDDLYGGSLSAFLSALSGGQGLDRDEVEALRVWFEEVSGDG
jgi:BlaI family penicillinase repressor